MLGGYIDLWNTYTISVKKDLFNTTLDFTMEKYGFSRELTKKGILQTFLSEFLRQNRIDLIKELYFEVLDFKSEMNNFEMFEKICYIVLNMKGIPYNNY